MMKFKAIMMMEFKRIWTTPKYIALVAITVILSIVALIPKMTGALDESFLTFVPDQSFIVSQILSSIVAIAVLFFTVGIVANDIKNHWFRTVLSRAVSREVFIISKIAANVLSLLVVMIAVTAIPLIIFNVTSPVSLEIDFMKIIFVYLFYTLHGTLLIIISTWLSCLVPGLFNILILAIWMISENIINPIIGLFLWDVKAALIFQDFYFPGGFQDALQVYISNGNFPISELLWGFAAFTFFLTLLLTNINFIQIDRTSDD